MSMTQKKLFTAQRRDDRQALYNSGAWRRIRTIQLRKASLCQHCLEEGRLTVATVCDHINPVWESWQDFCRGPFQSLCRQCHSIKTAFDIPLVKKSERCKMRVKDV